MSAPKPDVPRPGLTRVALAALVTGILGAGPAAAGQAPAPAPASPPPAPTWQASLSHVARLESWRFFEPPPTGGDPDYAFLGHRLRLELRGRWRRVQTTLAAQHVGFVGLPDRASNPGPFGTGALYFDQGGRHGNQQQLYLRYANVRFPDLVRGFDLQVGRMAYASGAEAPSGVPKVEAVKRQRLDARLVGEFEWAIVQRGYDGVRADLTRPSWRATGIALMPTQGGFARVAGPTITDVFVGGVTASALGSANAPRRTQVQGFSLYYADRRPVTQRPDNTGRTAGKADIGITTIGGTLIGAYPAGAGEVDVFGWTAWQAGDWYGQDHRAYAVAAETGYQWSRAAWRPWVRAGLFRASGDESATDDAHGTFFPLLPTVRRYSQTTAYSTMNLNDVFVSVQARPRSTLGLRLDVHRLDLSSAADLWYIGSGATLDSGAVFGYAGRRSNGRTRLGTSVEGSADFAITSRLSVNGFLGWIKGGPVVTGTFRGDRLWFGYVESVISFATR
ncbi:MAG: alginate export family protein [Acidobacteria bacterium]|nr:alginate export family protein [Acidobacteriota bacterium]